MKNIIRHTISILFSFTLISLPISSQARPIVFNKLYVFGDSLSDIGNDFILTGNTIPTAVNYYQGRFSNGPVTFEYLLKYLPGISQATLKPSLGNVNYATDKAVAAAYGGATTQVSNYTHGDFQVPGLVGQVEDFISDVRFANSNSNSKKALYALWAGANDYLLPPSLLAGGENSNCPTNPNPVIPVVCNITDAIMRLYSSVGARYFVVPNLPDLGSLPIFNDTNFSGLPPSGYFTNLTIAHNNALRSALHQLEKKHPDIHILYVDIYSIMNTLIQIFPQGNQIGPAGDCLFLNPSLCTQPDNGFKAPGYVFWDAEHPTTDMQKIWAFYMWISMQLELDMPK
jgi:phospholipase/lecithinase/hemolysin